MNENELRVNPRPWMTDDSIDFIESKLRPTDTVIEFGGGGVAFSGQRDPLSHLQSRPIGSGLRKLLWKCLRILI